MVCILSEVMTNLQSCNLEHLENWFTSEGSVRAGFASLEVKCSSIGMIVESVRLCLFPSLAGFCLACRFRFVKKIYIQERRQVHAAAADSNMGRMHANHVQEVFPSEC